MLRFFWIVVAIFLGSIAQAQDRRPSHCIAIADAAPGIEYLHRASLSAPPSDPFTVRIRYIDHSMFLIQGADGFTAVTDYAGFLGPVDFAPELVTMNNSHSTHWTPIPDPRISHVLKGWSDGDGPAEHYIELDEVLVRNVPTDTRSGFDGIRLNGNSIFVFEIAGLCIGHLGHLHHIPDDAQFAALGRLDVVMAAVDGGRTLDLPSMVTLLERLKSSVVLPMHWFGRSTLDSFLVDMRNEGFDVRQDGQSEIEISLRNLPERPTVIVLEPRFLQP